MSTLILGNAGHRPDLLLPEMAEEEFVIVLGGIGGRQACDTAFEGFGPNHRFLAGPQDYLGYINVYNGLGDHDYLTDQDIFAIRGGAPKNSTACIECSGEEELPHDRWQYILDHLLVPPSTIVTIEPPREISALMFGVENRSITGHALQAVFEKSPPITWVFSNGGPSATLSHKGTLFKNLGVRERFYVD